MVPETVFPFVEREEEDEDDEEDEDEPEDEEPFSFWGEEGVAVVDCLFEDEEVFLFEEDEEELLEDEAEAIAFTEWAFTPEKS